MLVRMLRNDLSHVAGRNVEKGSTTLENSFLKTKQFQYQKKKTNKKPNPKQITFHMTQQL